MSELTDMTKEELASSLNEHVNEIDQLVLELEERYDFLWNSYEELNEDYNRLGYKNIELKEENEKLEQQGKEFPGYKEGFEDGKQSMQDKANKICEYWNNNNTATLIALFDGMILSQIFEDIEMAYNKILEHENKEQEEKIRVGDELVDSLGYKFIVTMIEGKIMCMIDKYGDYRFTSLNNELFTKTGKHYPLEEMLKELE